MLGVYNESDMGGGIILKDGTAKECIDVLGGLNGG